MNTSKSFLTLPALQKTLCSIINVLAYFFTHNSKLSLPQRSDHQYHSYFFSVAQPLKLAPPLPSGMTTIFILLVRPLIFLQLFQWLTPPPSLAIRPIIIFSFFLSGPTTKSLPPPLLSGITTIFILAI